MCGATRLDILANLEESLKNLLGRIPPVLIEQVDVLYSCLGEPPPVVALLVETDHASNPQPAEYRYVIFGEQRFFSRLHLSPTYRWWRN